MTQPVTYCRRPSRSKLYMQLWRSHTHFTATEYFQPVFLGNSSELFTLVVGQISEPQLNFPVNFFLSSAKYESSIWKPECIRLRFRLSAIVWSMIEVYVPKIYTVDKMNKIETVLFNGVSWSNASNVAAVNRWKKLAAVRNGDGSDDVFILNWSKRNEVCSTTTLWRVGFFLHCDRTSFAIVEEWGDRPHHFHSQCSEWFVGICRLSIISFTECRTPSCAKLL